jgi:hypothetical protein
MADFYEPADAGIATGFSNIRDKLTGDFFDSPAKAAQRAAL